MATQDFTPYSTATPYFPQLPQWMGVDDAQRIAAYQLYEEMYWGANAQGVELEDGEALLLPVGKGLVEAINRYLAVGWDFNVTGTDPTAIESCTLAFKKLFKREKVQAKVNSQKRYGLIRGDAMLHIVADPNAAPGSRISIFELDPASYFPVYTLDEPDKIIGCYIVDQFTDAEDKLRIRRQTYMKTQDELGNFTGEVTSELAVFETEGWDERFGAKPEDIKLVTVLVPEYPLPAPISQLPVYTWQGTHNPVDIFGSSIMRGLETLLKKIDQTMTDTDLALALASLGVYTTDSGSPVDEAGAPESNWIIGPGRVVEHKLGTTFKRVPGITSVQPPLDHVNYLESKARQGAGVSPIAAGDIDVATAESGIALKFKLLPTLAANTERELEIIGTLDQMLYDLQTMWFPAYEQLNFGEVIVESKIKDPVPENRDATISELLTLYEADAITLDMLIVELQRLGYKYAADPVKSLTTQKEVKAAAADPFAARAAAEQSAGDDDSNV